MHTEEGRGGPGSYQCILRRRGEEGLVHINVY